MDSGTQVFFAFVPELLDYFRYTFDPQSRVTMESIFEEVKSSPLLILDDLGSEHNSPWAEEKLYQIFVHRHNHRLPTVITSRVDFNNPPTRRHSPKERQDSPEKQELVVLPTPIVSRIRDFKISKLIRIAVHDYRIRAPR